MGQRPGKVLDPAAGKLTQITVSAVLLIPLRQYWPVYAILAAVHVSIVLAGLMYRCHGWSSFPLHRQSRAEICPSPHLTSRLLFAPGTGTLGLFVSWSRMW